MPETRGESEESTQSLARPAKAIKLEEFIQAASSAALRAMQAHALTPNPDADEPGKGRPPLGRPPVLWNPQIIIGLILRNELGGDVKQLGGLRDIGSGGR